MRGCGGVGREHEDDRQGAGRGDRLIERRVPGECRRAWGILTCISKLVVAGLVFLWGVAAACGDWAAEDPIANTARPAQRSGVEDERTHAEHVIVRRCGEPRKLICRRRGDGGGEEELLEVAGVVKL